MKTKIELEIEITKITTIIYKDYPELTKYISEMPLSNINNGDLSIKDLEDYYNSLEEIMYKYATTHIRTNL